MITHSVWLTLYKHLKNLLLSLFLTCNLAAIQAQPTLVFDPFIQHLSRPVEITNAKDGSGRLFIIEQDGLIKIWKDGHVIKNLFSIFQVLCLAEKNMKVYLVLPFLLIISKRDFFSRSILREIKPR